MTPQTDNYWRIQTAKSHKDIQKHHNRRGLDKYWDFPYIVDVEFDIGTFYSRSLSRIRDGLVLEDNKLNFEHPDSVYMLSNKIINGVQFTILGKKGTEDEIAEIIHQIGKGHFKVKCPSYEYSATLNNLGFLLNYTHSHSWLKTNFWWDVENDWMAFLSGDNNINVHRFIEAMTEGQQYFLKRKDKGLLKY